ncbi:MAG: hypothetical protein ACRD3O_20415, partial [Terriglobia bacterium]
ACEATAGVPWSIVPGAPLHGTANGVKARVPARHHQSSRARRAYLACVHFGSFGVLGEAGSVNLEGAELLTR